jgi:hypothetical protein
MAQGMQRPAAGSKLRFSVAHATGEVRRPPYHPHPTTAAAAAAAFDAADTPLPVFIFSSAAAPSNERESNGPTDNNSHARLSRPRRQDPDYPARELHFHTPQTRQGLTFTRSVRDSGAGGLDGVSPGLERSKAHAVPGTQMHR